jgi:hypothetical protein
VSEGVDDVWDDEAEYTRYLDNERRLYALALADYGGIAPDQAEREALERYPYEPPGAPHRGLIFHDLAWHWAMIRLHGHGYWRRRPELQAMPEAFRLVSERLHSSPTKPKHAEPGAAADGGA